MSSEATASSSRNKQKLHFVTGKGGVGKSAVAAALAKRLSSEGHRVLLVELGNESYIGPSMGLSGRVGFEPRPLAENLHIAVWDAENCLRDYVLYLVKVERIYKLFFENKVMRSFIDVAPGLKELSILGKATSHIRNVGPSLDYDHIVIDSYSSGHTLALLKAPFALSEVVTRGPMGQQARAIGDVLKNPKNTFFYGVTLPEELPVTELIEFKSDFQRVLPIPLRIVVDKYIKTETSWKELQSKDILESPAGDFAQYLAFKLKTQEKQMTRLEAKEIFAKLPLYLESPEYAEMIDALSERLPNG